MLISSDQRTCFHCLLDQRTVVFLCKMYKCLPFRIIQFQGAFLDAAVAQSGEPRPIHACKVFGGSSSYTQS